MSCFFFQCSPSASRAATSWGAVGNHAAQGAHGFHGRAVGEVLEGEGTAIHITSFFLGWNVKGKIFFEPHRDLYCDLYCDLYRDLYAHWRECAFKKEGHEWARMGISATSATSYYNFIEKYFFI